MGADAAVSAAVVVAGLAILMTGQQWIDPVMSLAVAVVILWGSFGLCSRNRMWMSLAGVPSGTRLDEVEAGSRELTESTRSTISTSGRCEHDRNRAHRPCAVAARSMAT